MATPASTVLFPPRKMKKSTPKKTIKSEETRTKGRPLFLKSFSYSEYLGEARQWVLEGFEIGDIALLVGKNSSGKSRLLRVINGLARLLTGEQPKVYESGTYKLCLASDDIFYTYELIIINSAVVKEALWRDGDNLLDRGENGIGQIYAEKIGDRIDFETPPDQIAARSRRDTIQHSFFDDLYHWANYLRYFEFGSSLGQTEFAGITEKFSATESEKESRSTSQVTGIYVKAFNTWGDAFDKAVLRDLALLGYPCTAVEAESLRINGVHSPYAIMQVKEKDVGAKVTQLTMSQGMFRALSVVIQLNFLIFKKIPRTILIDDIGEGLDFSRSQTFISMLIERTKANNMQLMMTTNDRFVMNGVSLDHWGIVDRKGSRVKVVNKKNSPSVFSDYQELGLNNFEFFAGNFFAESTN